VDFLAIPAFGRTIASSTSRRIRTGTAALGDAEFPSNSRSYRWVRRRNGWCELVSIRKPRGYQFDMRFSAGKRYVFPALRSTGSLPGFWTWNSPRGIDVPDVDATPTTGTDACSGVAASDRFSTMHTRTAKLKTRQSDAHASILLGRLLLRR